MKLPALRVNSLPNLYKHCSTVMCLHIDMDYIGSYETKPFISDYLTYIRNQMYTILEGFFVTSQASKVIAQEEPFVVFKTNTEKNILSANIQALFAETYANLKGDVELSYQYLEVAILQKNSEIKIFKAHKVGDNLLTDCLLQHSNPFNHKAKPRGKQLVTIEEFRTIYNSRASQKTIHAKFPDHMRDEEDNSCEYYI